MIINPSLGYGEISDHIPFSGKLGVLGEHAWGTLAEYVIVPAVNAVPKPENLGWHKAAAFGLAAGTAYRMLRRARLSEGDVLLVVGVGGGVSSAGMLLGQILGADVYVTSRSQDKIEWAIEMGAKAGFRSDGEFSRELQSVASRQADVVFESVGPATWDQSMRSLTPGGRIVTCGSTSGRKVEITVPVLFFRHLEIIGSSMFDHEDFARILEWVESGELPVVIDRVFAFEDLPEALARMESADQLGKLVIEGAS